MIIHLPPNLEAALVAQAQQRGTVPQVLALDLLERQLVPSVTPIDDWERKLFAAAVDCEVNIPDVALSREGLYE